MRIKSLLKILLLSLLTLNCSEDDSSNNNSVIGNWILVNSTIGGEIDFNDCNSKSTMKFTNNQFESTFFNLLNSDECRPQTSKASYTIENDKIILSRNGLQSELSFEIKNNLLLINTIHPDSNNQPLKFISTYKRS